MPTLDRVAHTVLTINGGSSSIKFALFDDVPGGDPRRRLEGAIERVGTPQAQLRAKHVGDDNSAPITQPVAGTDPAAAVHALIDWLEQQTGAMQSLSAIAHRVVHGGPTLFEPQQVTPGVLETLRSVAEIDPDHLPGELALIDAFTRRCPGVRQVVCFDTAFHRDLPRVAQLLPLPPRYAEMGLRRYGFHGLSYQYLMGELARVAGPEAAKGRVVLAHLGSGASLAAVHGGKPIDTTMSFTPAAGLVMGTRAGDLDPGVLIYLMRNEHASAEDLSRLINHESGLKGMSQSSADTRDLLAKRASDGRADDALSAFCMSARQHIAAVAAAMGGIDTLVFAGGIGENAPEIRTEICSGLGFLGISLDAAANAANGSILSSRPGPVTVRRIPTDEEIVLARAALAI